MQDTITPAAGGNGDSVGTRAAQALGLGVIVFAWLLLFARVRVDWVVNPQYGYGWFVPLLGGLLAWRRWTCRPDPRPTEPRIWFTFVAAVSLGCLLPLSLILEANPEWRLPYWVQGFLSVSLSLALIGYAGGRSWMRHFAYPVLFLLVAIPWPVGWENALIQGLMRFVATLTVQVLDLQGIPAFQQGNLIQVTAGLVGVDEACSGVRSLQTSLFVALYLGEHHRLRPLRRVFLVAAGLGIAIAANTGRTWFLTWLAATRDLTTMNAWHDTAGMVVLFVVLAGLWLLVCRVPASATDWKAHSIPGSRPVPVVAGLSMLVWLAALGVITELWYRAHETAATQQSQWALLFPEKAAAFRDIEISEKATAMLRQTEGRAAGWTDPEGNDWQVFFLRWAPGCNSAQLAKGHRPEICLPGTGFQLTEQMEAKMFRIGARELPIRQYVFEMRGRTLHVFYCNWEDRVLPADRLLSNDGSQGSRLQAVWLGRRNLGQRVLEVMIRGPGSPEEAAETLATGLAPLLREEPPPGS